MPTLTKKGYDKFLAEHVSLLKDRSKAIQNIVQKRELGEQSENAGYREAKSRLRRIDNRIRYLDKLLRSSRVVVPPKDGLEYVKIGVYVTLHDSTGSFRYCVVDSVESDVLGGKISIRSPLGKELVGKKVGETIRVHTPQGVRVITIDSLKYE